MRRDTHIVFSLMLISFLLKNGLTPIESMEWVLLTMLGSLFPDLDYWLRKYPLMTHRRTLHNLWALMITSLLIYYLAGDGWFPWVIGYISHLGLDSLTRVGIDFLLVRRRIKGPFRTGGLVDRILLVVSGLILSYRFLSFRKGTFI